jgi:hypothetical protein
MICRIHREKTPSAAISAQAEQQAGKDALQALRARRRRKGGAPRARRGGSVMRHLSEG